MGRLPVVLSMNSSCVVLVHPREPIITRLKAACHSRIDAPSSRPAGSISARPRSAGVQSLCSPVPILSSIALSFCNHGLALKLAEAPVDVYRLDGLEIGAEHRGNRLGLLGVTLPAATAPDRAACAFITLGASLSSGIFKWTARPRRGGAMRSKTRRDAHMSPSQARLTTRAATCSPYLPIKV
jgi:hypothetical protein